jgi:beta-glucosidase
LKVAPGKKVTDVSFTVKNTGSRDGAGIAQVYAALPASASEPPKRLIGWKKVWLKAGESKQIRVPIESKYLSIWDDATNEWRLVPGSYEILVGASSANRPLHDKFDLK